MYCFRLVILLYTLLLFYTLRVSSLHVKKLSEENCTAILNKSGQKIGNQSLLQSSESAEELLVQCPTWFHWNRESGACQAGPQLDGIVLSNLKTHQTSILQCNCMTADEDTLRLGACLYTCNAISGYYPLPCHVSDLTNFTCADLNRQGPLCGECRDGYAPPVYSYELECVKCENYHYNWLKYLAVAFLPLTVFFVIVTFFSISFTSPLLSGVVMFFQLVTNPTQMTVIILLAQSGLLSISITVVRVISTLAIMWNLDFLRVAYPPFCLHPKITTLQTLALDYLIASYPLLLIILTYVLVRLHDGDYKLVVWVWKPFSRLKFRRQQRTSMIDVFASFVFLSTSRLLTASFNFLMPTYMYIAANGNTTNMTMKHFVLNAPTVEYFGRKHLPFALLALVVLLLAVVLPILLLLVYPFHWFQSLLNKLNLNSHALRTFMDVFQGSFKDGTNGSRDCRFFSAFLLLIGLLQAVIFSLTLSSFFYPMVNITILVYCILLIVFQPYKRKLHNAIAVTMAIAEFCTIWGLMINIQALGGLKCTLESKVMENICGIFVYVSIILMGIGIAIPFLYLFGLLFTLVFITLFKKNCKFTRIFSKI